MSETTPSRPVRCSTCAKPLDSPICCTNCGTINPYPPDALDYFEVFGLEPGYDVDDRALHEKYLSLTRTIHPDVAGRESADTRQQSLSLSSDLNRAYEALRDPAARAEYLLSRVAEDATLNDRSVPRELLGEIMTLREEIEEARSAGDAAALETLRRQITERHEAVLANIATLGRSLTHGHRDTQKRLREQLNVAKYWNSLLDQLPAGMA